MCVKISSKLVHPIKSYAVYMDGWMDGWMDRNGGDHNILPAVMLIINKGSLLGHVISQGNSLDVGYF